MDDSVSRSLVRVVESSKNFVRFLDGMDPIQMLHYLRPLLSDHDEQRVRRSVTNAGRSDREANVMLWYAIKRAPYWWVPFIEALDSCGYTHLSGILKDNLEQVHPDSCNILED